MSNANKLQTEAIRSMLANDEASSDEELRQHFVSEVGVTAEQAAAWVALRSSYLNDAPSDWSMPSGWPKQ